MFSHEVILCMNKAEQENSGKFSVEVKSWRYIQKQVIVVQVEWTGTFWIGAGFCL